MAPEVQDPKDENPSRLRTPGSRGSPASSLSNRRSPHRQPLRSNIDRRPSRGRRQPEPDPPATSENNTGNSINFIRDGENSGASLKLGGSSTRPGNVRLTTPGIKSSEESPNTENDPNQVGKGFSWDASGKGTRSGRVRFRLTRKQAAGGGIAGIVVAVAFGGFSVVQGPLEFLHIGQLMERFHFTSIEDTKDGRLMKIARFIRDPSKPQNTRMGIIGNAVADRLEAKVEKATGLKFDYRSPLGRGTGRVVNRDHAMWKDKSTSQIVNEFKTQWFLTDAEIRLHPSSRGPPVIELNIEKMGYFTKTRFNRQGLQAAGLRAVPAYVGGRVLTTRAGWSFHPIQALDQKALEAFLKGSKTTKDKVKAQFRKDQIAYEQKGIAPASGTPEKRVPPDGSGNPDPGANNRADQVVSELDDNKQQATQASEAAANGDENGAKKFGDRLSVKVGAGGVAAIGVACMLHSIDAQTGVMRLEKVMLPLMRIAGTFISLKSQIEGGLDLTLTQLGFHKDSLHTRDENGKLSNWNNAKSIQAELGQPQTGKDVPKEVQVFDKGNSPFAFINEVPGLGSVCSALNSAPGQLFGLVLSGGPFNFVFQTAAMQAIASGAANWFSGDPVDTTPDGETRGNFINVGSRLSAGEDGTAAAGVPLDAGEEANLRKVARALDKEEFQSKGLAYRVFNPYDSRTLAAQLIDEQDPDVMRSMASVASGFGNIFGAALRAPSALFSSQAQALPERNYDYHGLKAVGFSASDQNDPLFENPFENACHVVGCHDQNRNVTGIFEDPNKVENYRERAQKCFGIKVTNDGNIWNINSKADKPVDIYERDGSKYPADQCKEDNTEWKRIRFWILDTLTIEAYDCYEGATDTSDESCTNTGNPNSTDFPADANSEGGVTTGALSELAQAILDSDRVTLNPNPESSLKAAARGDKSPAGIDKCGVQRDPVNLDVKLLGFLVDLSKEDAFTITSLTTGAHSCTSNHYEGKAADFGCDLDTNKADRIGRKYGISHNFESCAGHQHWHYSIGGR